MGILKKYRSVFSGGLEKKIQPERSKPSPTEVKETLNYMLREKHMPAKNFHKTLNKTTCGGRFAKQSKNAPPALPKMLKHLQQNFKKTLPGDMFEGFGIENEPIMFFFIPPTNGRF